MIVIKPKINFKDKRGSIKDIFYNSSTPDDVLIGNILTKNQIYCSKNIYLGYVWDNEISIAENLQKIDANPQSIFIRVRDQKNVLEFKKITNILYNIYQNY